MKKRHLVILLLVSSFILLAILIMQPLEMVGGYKYIDILFPEGVIGRKQLELLLIIQGVMLVVVIPVFILTYYFSWKYRAGNPKARYDPDFDHHPAAEYIWWGVPCIIVLIIGILTWIRTHQLDPYRPIDSPKEELVVQAVALQWKWLFIYPKEKIASVNFLHIPKGTPIHFEITADAPMNSLWIPKLGGQIYAMPKMKTELFLIADDVGDFRGSSANISGKGFAGMHFITRSSLEDDFQKWVESAKQSGKALNAKEYDRLAAPSQNNPVESYRLEDENLFEQIIMKYMHPKASG